MKNKKVIWIIVGMLIVLLILLVILLLEFMKLSVPVKPVSNKNVVEVRKGECSNDIDCPNNSFCDINRPGGLTPYGYESGEPYGSLKCINICKNNSDCTSNICKSYSIVTGDIIMNKLGCASN